MINRFEHSPWSFWNDASDDERVAQEELQRSLRNAHPTWAFGERCFVSHLAALDADSLVLGDRSYIAASAYITGDIRLGEDCSVNPFIAIRGNVRIGDAARIGAHTSILGFNHSMEPGTPVFCQPLVSEGIVIGDDVWIGSHVVILDGVTVGDHAVIGAGAVVTKDVEAGAVVVGNPARRVKWRVEPTGTPESALASRLRAFGETAREQAHAILARCWNDERALFADEPGAEPTLRAQCDALEIAELLTGTLPPQRGRDDYLELLTGWVDPETGLAATLAQREAGIAPTIDHDDVAYHVLCLGYAFDLLGAEYPHPFAFITEGDAASLARELDALPWADNAWNGGHHVDARGTALLWSLRRGDRVPAGWSEVLFGWLSTHADPRSGMWGNATAEGLLQLVNGFYRASRGTFAQFGEPLPYPEAVVDTVLRHYRDDRWFDARSHNACNVLDVAHPLWLTRGTRYRSDETRRVAAELIERALARWRDDEGFGFRASGEAAPGHLGENAGLQGTEMWLATIWYLADILGEADALGYRPRGVHRPEPAHRIGG